MYEGLDAVDRHDGNVVLIFSEQLVMRFDVHLFEGELILAAGARDCRFGFVTEMAAGTRINDYMRF